MRCDVCNRKIDMARAIWEHYPPRKSRDRVVGAGSIAVGVYCSRRCLYLDTDAAKHARWEQSRKEIQNEVAEVPDRR